MCGQELGERALSRVGALGAGGGQSRIHKALEGSYRSSAAQRTSAPCGGASCGARVAVAQTCAESGALLAVLHGHQKTLTFIFCWIRKRASGGFLQMFCLQRGIFVTQATADPS